MGPPSGPPRPVEGVFWPPEISDGVPTVVATLGAFSQCAWLWSPMAFAGLRFRRNNDHGDFQGQHIGHRGTALGAVRAHAQAPSVRRPRRSFDQFAQDRHQEPKFTRCGPACRGRSGCIPDNLNQMAHALDKSLANHSMIQIVQYDVQTDLPRLCNRWVVTQNRS
jgi:hypothetical protein